MPRGLMNPLVPVEMHSILPRALRFFRVFVYVHAAYCLLLCTVSCIHMSCWKFLMLCTWCSMFAARSSTALKKLWTRFADMAARTQQTFGVSGQNSSATASQQQRAFEAEMSQRGLLSGGARGGVEEEDLEFDDDEDMAAELGYRR